MQWNIQGFNNKKFFDKESLLDTLYTEGHISDKDYRMLYKLNCKTRISVITLVSESDAHNI